MHSSGLSLITREQGLSRLQLHSDPRIPSIGIKAESKLSFIERFKLSAGIWRHVKTLDSCETQKEFFISLKSFAKHTGLGGSDIASLNASQATFKKLSLIASIVSRNTDGYTPHETALVFKKLLSTNSKVLFQEDIQLNSENVSLASAQDKVHVLSIGHLLGEGCFSQVWDTQDLLHPNLPVVLKTEIKASDSERLQSIFNKMKILNPNGEVIGIQIAHYKVVEILPGTTSTEKRTGFLAYRYDQNLQNFQFRDVNQLKNAFYQLISGLCYLHKRKWFHRDIKPSNFLYLSASSHGLERFDIADLDEVSHVKDIINILVKHRKDADPYVPRTARSIWGKYEGNHAYSSDKEGIEDLIYEFQKGRLSLRQATDKILQAIQSKDLFGLACSLQTFAGRSWNHKLNRYTCYDQLIAIGFDKEEAFIIDRATTKMLTKKEEFTERLEDRLQGLHELKALFKIK